MDFFIEFGMLLDDDLGAVPSEDEHEIELLGSVELVAGFQCGEPGGFDALSSSLTSSLLQIQFQQLLGKEVEVDAGVGWAGPILKKFWVCFQF